MNRMAGLRSSSAKPEEPGRLPLRMMKQEHCRHHDTAANVGRWNNFVDAKDPMSTRPGTWNHRLSTRVSSWMREIAYLVGSVVLGLVVVVAVVVFLYGLPLNAPSRDECLTLWNAPHNAAARERVAAHDYPTAEIDGTFVEGRYQGCYASFVQGVGAPWALFSATRIPGEDRPLRWRLDMDGRRWGRDFPEPEPVPEPNANVLPDGSLSLRG